MKHLLLKRLYLVIFDIDSLDKYYSFILPILAYWTSHPRSEFCLV